VIDWTAVEMVCQGTSLYLKPDERKMVIRRLEHRMLQATDWRWSQRTGSKLTCEQVAERLQISLRSVERMQTDLPQADKRVCPDCFEDMWVTAEGVVEPHPDRYMEQCKASGCYARTGLAAIRPDLFAWVQPRAVDAC